jgi:hypothetical protein
LPNALFEHYQTAKDENVLGDHAPHCFAKTALFLFDADYFGENAELCQYEADENNLFQRSN